MIERDFTLNEISLTETALVAGAFFLLYYFTLCGASAAAHDGIFYLIRIDDGLGLSYDHNPLFHPHHLLYNLLALGWLNLCRLIKPGGDSADMVSLFNALWGSAALCVFYNLLRRRLRLAPLEAFVSALLPALSFGFWFYSACVEVYIAPLFFLLLCLHLFSGETQTRKTWLAAGLCHGLAVLLHQAHGLFLLTAVTALYLSARRDKSGALQGALCYFTAFISSALIPYLIVTVRYVKLQSLAEIWLWATKYAHDPSYLNPPAVSTLFKGALGFARSLTGLNFLFAAPALRNTLDRVLAANDLMDDLYLVRRLSPGAAYSLCLALAIFGLLLACLALTSFRHGAPRGPARRLAPLALSWGLPYALFFTFWVGNNVELWIPQSLCWWLLFLTYYWSMERWGGKKLLPLSISALLLFILNFNGAIMFLMKRENNFYYQKSAPLADITSRGDLIVIAPTFPLTKAATASWNSETLHSYLLKYTEANIININEVDRYTKRLLRHNYPDTGRAVEDSRKRLRNAVKETLAGGNKVLFFKEAVEPPPPIRSRLGLTARVVEDIWEPYKERHQVRDFELHRVYIVTPPTR